MCSSETPQTLTAGCLEIRWMLLRLYMCLSKISMGEPVTHTRTVIAHFWKGLSVLCPGTRKTNRIICYNLIESYAHLTEWDDLSTLRELELQQVAPRLLELLRRQGLATLTRFQSRAVNQRIMRRISQLLVTYDYDEAYLVA